MILVALGANLPGRFDTPRAALASALEAMKDRGIRIIKTSNLYLTAPVPASDQPWYHNAVAVVETTLSPFALLEELQNIEHDFGRVRTERNAPRVLDLDLIAYNDIVLDKPELIVPHPRMTDRAFVLLPLSDVAPGWIHPISKKPLKDLMDALPGDQIAKSEGVFP
jgi:2-amino-4-hydroxy-6-hydroxymethyldihydropteridine diphosphokinase